MSTIQVPETTSELRNVLVQIVMCPGAPWEVIASAAELISLDVRFDNWFLHVAKRTKSTSELEEFFEISDKITDNIQTAWVKRGEGEKDWKSLLDQLRQSYTYFRGVLEREGGSEPLWPVE